MWNPTCYGDPGKVSDAEYHCTTDDAGGVHSNSGVPNHAFALLVDGGTLQRRRRWPASGSTKAAHIFWRTQTNYLTPTSDFTDLADGLAASCTDLTGRGHQRSCPPRPATSGLRRGRSPAEDCAAVAAAARPSSSTRSRSQCNFKPLLDPDAPALVRRRSARPRSCGPRTSRTASAGWTQDEESSSRAASGYRVDDRGRRPRRPRARRSPSTRPPTRATAAGDADDISSRNGHDQPGAHRCPRRHLAADDASTTTSPPRPATTAAT